MGGRRGRLISASNRKMAIELIEEATAAGARESVACKELGITQRTLQRWRSADNPLEDGRPNAKRPAPSNKLSEEEVNAILEVVNSPEFQSKPPTQIVPYLADRGVYLASESTMYRILREHKMQHHRGRSKEPSTKPIATHYATGPNQVWMWDITWLRGPVKGFYYYLYVILDLFSRKIIAWEVWEEESAENAGKLVRRGFMSEQIAKHNRPLVLHSDNGSPMRGVSLLETLYALGITPSRSRPRVSNDNAFAESAFKTCKYRPSYPASGFKGLDDARSWMLTFVRWYNNEHHHSGVNYLTPEQRHSGRGKAILEGRKKVYEAARARNPERWSRNIRNWNIDDKVWLNLQNKITDASDNEQFS